jgi:hypothetical protein
MDFVSKGIWEQKNFGPQQSAFAFLGMGGREA